MFFIGSRGTVLFVGRTASARVVRWAIWLAVQPIRFGQDDFTLSVGKRGQQSDEIFDEYFIDPSVLCRSSA